MPKATCVECGLPVNACNSLAMYRNAIEAYGRGRKEDGDRYAKGAKEFYDDFRAIGPTTTRRAEGT